MPINSNRSKSLTLSKGRNAHQESFRPVVEMIEAARHRAFQSINRELIDLYWEVGKYISERLKSEGWGKSTIVLLARFIQKHDHHAPGFSAPNLWRMRQFYEAWAGEAKLSALLRELSWTNNILILGKCKHNEERKFYLRMARRERWSSRELERQIEKGYFQRAVLSPVKLSAALRELHPRAIDTFKDCYLVDFLDLPDVHNEADLHSGLVEHLKDFLIELGRDFCYVGSEYLIQVGGQDFRLDLLFFNRALNCLVAFELKTEGFKPDFLGKLNFYLEALDRDVRKKHERPSIGVLLCATKDNEVVEYALSRSASPALIAEYQTRLPNKRLLERKLHEFYRLASPESAKSSTPANGRGRFQKRT